MNIFFDLDGTLIDSKDRLYSLFSDLTNVEISFEQYWDLKRNMISNESILHNHNFSKEQISDFTSNWMRQIELPEYLEKDQKFTFTIKVLESLRAQGHKLYVVTARQSIEAAKDQLNNLGILEYFEDSFITEQKLEKCELIQQNNINISQDDILVGDTGMDIRAGKTLGIKTVAVLSGFRNKEQLTAYSPDYIYRDILEFSENLQN